MPRIAFAFTLFLMFASPAHAGLQSFLKWPRPGLTDEEVKSIEQHVLDAGDTISDQIGSTAQAIDLTLAGRQYTKAPNTSQAVISQMFSYTEGGQWRKSTDFGLNLRLPNLEKRWQLRFSSYDQEKEQRDLLQSRLRTQPRERDLGAGLGFFQSLGRVRTSFLPRLQLKSPLEMSYTLRFERDFNWTPVRINPRLDLYADPKKGTGEFTQLEFQLPLDSGYALSLENSEEYRANENFFSTQHEVALDQALSPTEGIGYAVIFGSNSKPSFHLDSLVLSVGYGRQIYPGRLKWSLSPFWGFAKSDQFKGKTGISATADLIF